MRIGIIGTRGFPYVYSGYETFVAELAPRLVERGHNVTVYCHRGLFAERPAEVRGVKLIYVPALEKKILSQFSHSLLSTLHAVFSPFDVLLFVNTANGPFGLLTKTIGKRTAINVDGLEWVRPKWKGMGSRYFYYASKLSTKVFDVVVSDSERMAEIYQREFHSPSVTIAYGANVGYSTNPETILRWGLKPDGYYLVVGRLIPDNNADIIIKGFEKTYTERKLVILGDVPYKDAYVKAVRSTRDARIIFPGYVNDPDLLRELYCNAFAYVHGHEYGGTNPSLLNALGYGCCIMALDTPFSREVLLDERHGVYFAKDPDSVREVMERLEKDGRLAHACRNSARSRIAENYSWERITGQYDDLFRRMSGEK